METNPLHYGLPIRTQLEDLDDNQLGIRKVIKSRIIQKDAAKIVEIANQIKSINPDLKLMLICSRNICSKSLALLESESIGVMFVKL
ncbi:MAG: hypothetical protein GZ091_01460 [Paludibacter sp.]|nr:hypothetical protein [Paludibacter sp.]